MLSHVLMFAVQVFVLGLKQYEYHQLAQALFWVVFLNYLIRIFYANYVFKIHWDLIIKKEFKCGNIIMISSITDSRTIKGQFSYAVSKGGLTRMTEVMALEAAKFNIRVNALAPGYFLTDLSRLLLESPMSEEFKKGIPMRRFGEFPELDGPLLLLASDASQYMTGSVVVVDGGHICSSL